MMEYLEIYDVVSGEVVASGSHTSLCNDTYDIQWDNLNEKWYLRTYDHSIDDYIEDLLGTSDYELEVRAV